MSLNEYKALRYGSTMRMVDEMEREARQAYNTAIAGGFGKDGKPIVKKFEDLFDRNKIERDINEMSGKVKKVDKEVVERFRKSKEHAENLLNGITATFEGKEDD